MAQQKSTNLTAVDSKPPTILDSQVAGGFTRRILDTVEVADNANADTVIFGPGIPVDALLPSVKLATDDLGSAGTADVGFFKKNADGTYTVVSAAALANDLDVNTVAVGFTERRYSVKGIETVQQKVWQLAGLSARPAYDFLYLGLTFDTGTTQAGTASIDVEYRD